MITGCNNSVLSIAEAETAPRPTTAKQVLATSTSRLIRLCSACAIGNTPFLFLIGLRVVTNAVIEPATDLLDARCRKMHGRTVAGWLQISLVLSSFCHHFNQTNVHYRAFPFGCQEEKFEEFGKNREFWGCFIVFVDLSPADCAEIQEAKVGCFQKVKNIVRLPLNLRYGRCTVFGRIGGAFVGQVEQIIYNGLIVSSQCNQHFCGQCNDTVFILRIRILRNCR